MIDSYVFYKDKLGKEYQDVFDQIEMYVQSQNVDDDTVEEHLGELLDIFLNAEEEGRPVQEITGRNLEQFCKAFCSEFSAKNRILYIADWVKSISKVFVVISVLDIIFEVFIAEDTGRLDIWENVLDINTSAYLIGIGAACLLTVFTNLLVRHIMFKRKQISIKRLRTVSCIGVILEFLIIVYLLGVNDSEFFNCPSWVILASACIYLVLYYVLYGRRVKRQKVKFIELVQAESQRDIPEEMEKKFKKARKKNLKKGKGELSLEEFIYKEEKECSRLEKSRLFYYVLPLICTAAAFVVTLFLDGFEGGADMLIFILITLGVEYPIMLGIWRISQFGVRERRAWIKEKREEINQRR